MSAQGGEDARQNESDTPANKTKETAKPIALTAGYQRARRNLGVAAGALLLLDGLGLKLEEFTIFGSKFNPGDRGSLGLALALAVVWLFVRVCVEWFLCDTRARRPRAALIDLYLNVGIAGLALTLSAYRGVGQTGLLKAILDGLDLYDVRLVAAVVSAAAGLVTYLVLRAHGLRSYVAYLRRRWAGSQQYEYPVGEENAYGQQVVLSHLAASAVLSVIIALVELAIEGFTGGAATIRDEVVRARNGLWIGFFIAAAGVVASSLIFLFLEWILPRMAWMAGAAGRLWRYVKERLVSAR